MSPPAAVPKKRVDCINRGSRLCKELVNSIKAHQRRAIPWATNKCPNVRSDNLIKFRESESLALDGPHDDALVLTLNVTNCEVSRILVNNESSVNIIYLSTLQKLDIDDSEIEKGSVELVGSDGKLTSALGSIKLAVYAYRKNKLVEFLVLDCASAFNMIL